MNEIQRNLLKRKLELEELANDMGVHFLKALEIYTKFNGKLYSREEFPHYNKQLEDKAFDLTERWLSIYN